MTNLLHKAFIPDRNYIKEGVVLRNIFGTSATSGDIGIEIECEGNKFKKTHLPEPWRYEADGSLRGYDNAEYIFKGPQKFEDVPKAIEALWAMFSDHGTILDDSNRTSVHVHLNVQNFHLNRLCAFFGLYVAVEEVLTSWCGEHRVGNLFCLRAVDAPNIVTKMKKFLSSEGRDVALTEGLHYSGLNIHAMQKYGSVEIRSLRGVTDPSLILDWVAVLERIYKLSADYPDPRTITDNFSGGGPIEFLRMILGDRYDIVTEAVGMSDGELRSSLYGGIRLAQDLCYCRDWSRYQPVDVAKDPFGRNKKSTSEILSMIAELHGSQTVSLSTASITNSPYMFGEPGFVSAIPSGFPPPTTTWDILGSNEPSEEEPEEEDYPEWDDESYDEGEPNF